MGRIRSSEVLTVKKGARGKERAGTNLSQKTGFDGLQQAPWRKTVSIFKQPVTLVHTTSKVTQDMPSDGAKRVSQKTTTKTEKPRQIFWTKSLEHLSAMVPVRLADRLESIEENEHIEQKLILAGKIEAAVGVVSEEAAAATLYAALQTPNGTPLVGQTATKKQIDSNPLIHANVDQPFVQLPIISEQDISMQERRVLDARRRLQELYKSIRT